MCIPKVISCFVVDEVIKTRKIGFETTQKRQSTEQMWQQYGNYNYCAQL
jgi:hypothetical protein